MAFELGSWVKWKHESRFRLGCGALDVGQVIGVHKFSPRECEIDVEFGDGDVLHGAAGDWFEPAEAPEGEGRAGANSRKPGIQ